MQENKDMIINNKEIQTEEKKNNKISFVQFGKLSVREAHGDPRTIEASLDNVYEQFLKESKLDEDAKRQLSSQLNAEILQKKNQLEKLETEKEIIEGRAAEINRRVDEAEAELVKDSFGHGGIENKISFAIATVLTVGLALYLILIYSSIGYSALYGLKQGTMSIVNGNVFKDAMKKGAGTFALILTFPLIFIGKGFLIRTLIEQKKNWSWAWSLE